MFEVIPPRNGAAPAVAANAVAISVRRGPARKPGGRGFHVITFSVGRAVARTLGWRAGVRVVVAWGRGKYALGKVKIGPHTGSGPSWTVRANKHGDVFKIHTGALPETFSGALYRSTPVEHEVIERAAREPAPYLVVELPGDFHADADAGLEL